MKRNYLPCFAAAVGAAAAVMVGSVAFAEEKQPQQPSKTAPGRQNGAKASSTAGSAAGAARLQRLLIARRDLMKEVEARAKVDRSAGRGSGADVARATIGVLAAELEIEHTKAERIALRQQVVEATRLIEAEAESYRLAGVGNNETLYPSRLARIEAEIALEREKLRPAP